MQSVIHCPPDTARTINAIPISFVSQDLPENSTPQFEWLAPYQANLQQEHLSQLFERYFRVDGNKSQTSGLGLGLYISSEIIRRHGGEMGVESEINKGSSFWFTYRNSPGFSCPINTVFRSGKTKLLQRKSVDRRNKFMDFLFLIKNLAKWHIVANIIIESKIERYVYAI